MEIERIKLDSDTAGQDFVLPVFRFDGTGDGPAVYMQAAIHAHEMPGVVALTRLIPMLRDAEAAGRIAGKITLVPHANPVGLAQSVFGETLGRFDVNERINFNRSFPSQTPEMLTGKPASERLKSILLELAQQAQIVLDLHCDDQGPVYLYVAEQQLDEGLRLAAAMQAAVILTDARDEPVSFDLAIGGLWEKQGRGNEGRFAATVELRGMMDVTHEFAETDAAGLYRYLVEIGTVRDTLPELQSADPVIGDVDAAELIPTPVPGALLYDVEVGDWVSEGQRVAVVVTHAGSESHEVLAPFDGLVMTRRDRRLARRGDNVVKILRHPKK